MRHTISATITLFVAGIFALVNPSAGVAAEGSCGATPADYSGDYRGVVLPIVSIGPRLPLQTVELTLHSNYTANLTITEVTNPVWGSADSAPRQMADTFQIKPYTGDSVIEVTGFTPGPFAISLTNQRWENIRSYCSTGSTQVKQLRGALTEGLTVSILSLERKPLS